MIFGFFPEIPRTAHEFPNESPPFEPILIRNASYPQAKRQKPREVAFTRLCLRFPAELGLEHQMRDPVGALAHTDAVAVHRRVDPLAERREAVEGHDIHGLVQMQRHTVAPASNS